MPESRDPVLPALVRGVVLLLILGFAAFTLLLTAARLAGWSFAFVSRGAIVIAVVSTTIAARQAWLARRRWSAREWPGAAALVLLTLASGVVACAINAPDEDDSLYVPPAVTALAHPEAPLRIDYSWIVPFANGATPGTSLGVLFNNVESGWACVSRATGIDVLTLYQGVGAFVFGAAFALIYFWLLSRFSSSAGALAGATAIVIAGFLLFRAGGGYGSILNKIWMGKAIVMAVMIPAIATLAFEFMAVPTVRRWGWLFIATIAATGLSSSSLFLAPALLLALTPAAFVWTRSWRAALAVALAAWYPVAIAAFYSVTYKQNIANLEEVAPASSFEIFTSGFVPYFATWRSLTALTLAIAILYLLARRTRPQVALLVWLGAAVLVFTNPITAGVVARHVTSTLVYNRIFSILPVFALTGAAVADLIDRSTVRVRILLMATLAESAALYGIHIAPHVWQIDVPKLQLTGRPHVGRPVTRLDSGLISDVREIERLAPAGNTLAAADYAIAIPMVTTRLPQYGLWPIDVITMYGEAQAAPDEGRMRYGAARFLIGQAAYQHDFGALLDTAVRNVILSNRLGQDLFAARQIALSHRFTLVRETPSYVLYTRAENR